MSNEPPPPVRRRPLVAIPGWMLFVCLFLPTLRVCSSPSAPIEFPPSYAVYLGAIAVAVGAMSSSLRVRRGAHATLLGLWFATGAGLLAALVGSALGARVGMRVGWMLAATELVLTIVLIARLARVSWSVRGVIGGWIAHALIASAWNAWLAAETGAVWGAYFALGVSGALLAASAVALSSENTLRKDDGTDLPRAYARPRDL